MSRRIPRHGKAALRLLICWWSTTLGIDRYDEHEGGKKDSLPRSSDSDGIDAKSLAWTVDFSGRLYKTECKIRQSECIERRLQESLPNAGLLVLSHTTRPSDK